MTFKTTIPEFLKALDKLKETDPEAYKKIMKAAAEVTPPPPTKEYRPRGGFIPCSCECCRRYGRTAASDEGARG